MSKNTSTLPSVEPASSSSDFGRKCMAIGASLAGLSVIIGAFGAHGLKDWIAETYPLEAAKRLANWETGAKYQLYHAVAILLYGLTVTSGICRSTIVIPLLFLIGILCFSGSLYVLTVTDLKIMGAVAPIGGTSFIVGWGIFAWISCQATSVESRSQ